MIAQRIVNERLLGIFEYFLIIIFAIVPLFFSFPYRINIFLSWEGAYRLSIGQIPYKDFGLPLGYGFWIIPAIFFKIFGPAMITLIKAQVLINILSGLAFLSICKSLQIVPIIRFISLLVYIISFSFANFWPWYNHSVIVYEFIGLAFLFKFLLPKNPAIKGKIFWLIFSGLFIFLSFFTKQDGGGLALFLCLALLSYYCILTKTFIPLIVFIASCFAFGFLFILPVSNYHFNYWFNYGQPPHNSRVTIVDLINDLFGGSHWLKFYLFLFIIFLIPYFKKWKIFIVNKRFMLLTLLVVGIWIESLIFQFTSYIPPDNNIFFHSFCLMFLLSLLHDQKILPLKNYFHLFSFTILVLFWWSGNFWNYVSRILPTEPPKLSPTSENIISRKTFVVKDSTDIPESKWIYSPFPVFKKISMPPSTVNGITRLVNNPNIDVKTGNAKVLNMTELTPLAELMGFKPETGPDQPLWYHLGVSMFNKQKDMFCNRIANNYYDLVLFETVPNLNNFYPFDVRKCLRKHYTIIDTFMAPRRPTNSTIEVYLPKN